MKKSSFFLAALLVSAAPVQANEELDDKWQKIKMIRDEANISIESKRAEKIIGSSPIISSCFLCYIISNLLLFFFDE